MASSSRYPPRLYEDGKAPPQLKSMNHNCHMSKLQMFKDGIGIDAWKAVTNSSVGVIAKFQELPFTFSALIVHYMLTHQLVVNKPYELWSLIDDQPIRFSLHEFEEITGLNCGPLEAKDKWDADHKDFWGHMKVSTLEGPSLNDLEMVLTRCSDWDFEERRMIGWLAIISVAILGISPSSKIPLKLAKRVLDPEVFNSYPWGRVACSSLIDSVKMLNYGVNLTYTLRGCVPVLLIWAYEMVHVFGERFGNRRKGDVPLLAYVASRPRQIEVVIKEEKEANNNKVRVRHLMHTHDEDVEPKWYGNYMDAKVTCMVEDIIENRLDRTAWRVVETPIKKRGAHVRSPAEDSVTTKTVKKKRAVSTECYGEKNEKEFGQNSRNKGMAISDLVEVIKALSERVESMEKNIAEKISVSLELATLAKVEALVDERLIGVEERIANLEDEVNFLKARLQAGENEEAENSSDQFSVVL